MTSEQPTHDAILECRALQLLAQNPGVADDGGELVASGCDSACVKPLDEKGESAGIVLGELDGVEGRPPGSFSEAGSEVRRVMCEEASVERPGFDVLAAAYTHADDGVLESRCSSIVCLKVANVEDSQPDTFGGANAAPIDFLILWGRHSRVL